MNSDQRPLLDLSVSERRLLRYTLVTFSAVTLICLIVLVIFVLGRIVATLHLLVFPLAVAGVLALVLFPLVEALERYARMSRLAAVVTLFLALALGLLTLLVLVIPAAVNQATAFIASIPAMAEQGYETVSGKFPRLLPFIEDTLANIEPGAWLPEADKAAGWTMTYVGLLVGMSFVPLYVFFALLSGERLREKAKEALFLCDHETQNEVLYLGQLFVGYVTAFFRGQLTIALIMGVIMAVGFTAVGLEAAIIFGLALGLLNIVPYLGLVVGLLTVLPVAYIQPDGGMQLVLLVLGVIAATQLIESFLLTPKIMADRSGLHPALVVISILFWGTVLGGVTGMILAVPLTAFLLTLGKHVKTRLSRTVGPERRAEDWSVE